MTLVCVLAGCLFPGEGYDQVLARAFGIPGLRFWPGPVPAASALSQARERLGELAVRRLFELGAETGDAELGLSALWHGLEVTAIDGTTMELDRNETLACEFGASSTKGRPLLRIVGHVRAASRRWNRHLSPGRERARRPAPGFLPERDGQPRRPGVPVDGTVSRGGRDRR